MGNACSVSSDESSCSTAIGSCKNEHCASSCWKKGAVSEEVRQAAVRAEEAADVIMKQMIHDHMHNFLQAHLPTYVADQIEKASIALVDYDIVSRNPCSGVASPTATTECKD